MNNFTKISPNELVDNPFSMLEKDWALVTAGSLESYNTMTVSWGGVGVLWGKNTATIYIRPQRYTRKFIEENEFFSISVLPEDYRKALTLCGRVSGRDHDKAKEAGITPIEIDSAVSFDEARLIFVCKKLYYSDIDPKNFCSDDVDKNYPDKDYHRMYIGEIVSAYKLK